MRSVKDQCCAEEECACRKHAYCVRKLTETRTAAAMARKAAPERSCPACLHPLPEFRADEQNAP